MFDLIFHLGGMGVPYTNSGGLVGLAVDVALAGGGGFGVRSLA